MKRKALVFMLVFFITTVTLPPSASQPYWTVMVYMDGDNDLETFAIDDLNEMESIGSDANVNMVVQIDRIPGFDSSNGDWTATRRYYVTLDPGGYNNTINSTLISDLGELNMGDPATLVDFVNWAKTTYPADYYLLVLWDHGDGWKKRAHITQKGEITRIQKKEPVKGVCYDYTDNDYLSTQNLGSALNVITSGGVDPVDVIGFDACLMAMLEVDYEVSPYCLYRVGSEEVEPGDGWDYQASMGWLTTNPTSTPDQIASQIVIDYMNFYWSTGFATQSAVDLSQTAALAAAVNTLAVDLTNSVSTYLYDIRNIREQVEEYSDTDFVDLYHFAQLVQATIPNVQIQADAVNVMNAVSAAVIQEGHNASHPNSHGISIYFPYGVCSYLPRYRTDITFASDTGWDEFIIAYFSTVPPPVHAVVLIDDDSGNCGYLENVEEYYTDILDLLGVPYDYYDASIYGTPDPSYLQAHSLVIWFTGSDFSTTLSPADESSLMQYLDGGGKLFLSSQDYVWDLKSDGRYPSTFLRTYLHTMNEGEDTGITTLAGVPGNAVGDGLGPYEMCWVLGSCSFKDYADWVAKDALSEYAFYNESSEYVAITYSGSYEVVFFPFRFEGLPYDISDPSNPLTARRDIMERILDFLGPIPTLNFLEDLFSTNTFFVAGDNAYCTDVLGCAKIAFALGQAGALENPEGRTDAILTAAEHDSGNLIPVGGPAINTVADEFSNYFGITYQYQAGSFFQINADGSSIYLNLANYPQRDISIVYVGRHNSRYILLVWGYGWEGTYAASTFLGDITNWDTYQWVHMLMLRWIDANMDGLVQANEITVEAYA